MSSYITSNILIVLAVVLASQCIVSAVPTHLRNHRFRTARLEAVDKEEQQQEQQPINSFAFAAQPNATPYPSAAELKPHVPFVEVEQNVGNAFANEPNQGQQPNRAYGAPPPTVPQVPPVIETDEEPPVDEVEEEVVDAVSPIGVDELDTEEVIAAQPAETERLTFARNGRTFIKSAKLRQQPRRARLQVQEQQQQRNYVQSAQPVVFYYV